MDYKLRILKEAEAVKAIGGIAALLRREGFYSSHLTTWRQEREAGMRQALTPKSRGPKRKPSTHQQELQQLRREILRLSDALARAEMIIDVQKVTTQVRTPVGLRPEGNRRLGLALPAF